MLTLIQKFRVITTAPAGQRPRPYIRDVPGSKLSSNWEGIAALRRSSTQLLRLLFGLATTASVQIFFTV
jgi:hypothetical protein